MVNTRDEVARYQRSCRGDISVRWLAAHGRPPLTDDQLIIPDEDLLRREEGTVHATARVWTPTTP